MIILVVISMSFIVYLWLLSFNDYLATLSKGSVLDANNQNNNPKLELLSLKDSLKASVDDFVNIISNKNSNEATKNSDLTKPNDTINGEILKFPSNY